MASASIGTYRALALLYNFSNTNISTPSRTSLQNTLNSPTPGSKSVSRYFSEASYGKFGLTSDVPLNWFSLSSTQNCNHDQHAAQAMQRAKLLNPSIDFRNYQYLIFVAPYSSCFRGLGTEGRTTVMTPDGPVTVGMTWISATYAWAVSAHVYNHELGHNLGLIHANFLNCGSVPISETGCSSIEYGDFWDSMGDSGYAWHYNSIQKEFLGWLEPTEVLSITESGLYQIRALEYDAPGAVKAARIARTANSTDALYVEFRRPSEFDVVPWSTDIHQSAVVHRYLNHDPGSPPSHYLIDPTPPTTSSSAWLPVGSTMTDPLTGTSIRTVSWDNDYLTIDVDVGTLPLSVQLTSPANSSSVQGDVVLVAEALPSERVDHVEFLTSLEPRILLSSDSTPPYEAVWPTYGQVHDGWSDIYVEAFDALGGSVQNTTHVFVANPDSVAPTIESVSPQDGEMTSGLFEVSAVVSDNAGIYSVTLLVNGSTHGAFTYSNGSYRYPLALPDGSYTLEIVAEDFSFNTTSTVLSVMANSQPPSAPANVHVTGVGDCYVSIAWSSPMEGDVESYNIYRNGELLQALPSLPPTLSFSDIHVQPSTAYDYEVEAVDIGGLRSTRSSTSTQTLSSPWSVCPTVDPRRRPQWTGKTGH